ncbi:MAG: DUF4831 family protein [Muribaculaceae bacterium]|nr:DUF4831 family protein [Muribaculaceae bacterium]
MKSFFFSLIFLGSFLGIQAQQTKLLTAEKHNEYGLVYSLPLTGFKIDVVAVKKTEVAAPFFKYSKIFTSDSNVISENSTEWDIETVKITPFGAPDDQNRFLMQLKPGATTFIGVAEDGMLLSINKEPLEISEEEISVIAIEGNRTTGKEYLEFMNEDFISAQSSYKQAQLLAEELTEIREAKISLTRGTAETMPTDGRQLEIMLENLDKQEQALTNAFKGSSWKERTVKSFYIIPEEEGKSVVCRLSLSDGLVNADDYSGDPLYLSLKVVEEPTVPVDAKGEEKKLPKDAVMYCIPGLAEVSLSFGGKELFQQVFPMSQFGFLFGLNPTLFTDKKEPSYALFDPTTGALVELGTQK